MTMRPSIVINWVLRLYTLGSQPYTYFQPLRHRQCSNVISFGSSSPEPFINVPVACVSHVSAVYIIYMLYVCAIWHYVMHARTTSARYKCVCIDFMLMSALYGGMRVLSAFAPYTHM